MSKTKKIILIILCLIGLGLSIELCKVFYNANFSASSVKSICAINEMFDCDAVAKTSYSQFLGVPLSVWGLILYLFILFMLFVDKIKNIKFLGFLGVFKNPASYIFCISLLSFCISIVLGSISIFKINSICIFCFMTYFIDLLIALIAKDWTKGIFYEIKNSFSDFVEAIKVRRYAFWFIMLVLLFLSILIYTSITNVLSPQIIKRNTFIKEFGQYKNIVNKNIMGPENADIVIDEFIDFNCAGCFIANLYMHRIVNEFENVKVIQHNVPLDITCNPNMKYEGHKNSCLKARYAIAAGMQNKYWQMSDMLFTDSPDDEKGIIEGARLLDFDIKKLKEDANSEKVNKEIEKSIKLADEKDVIGTPTIYIGMKKLLGINSYPDFKNLVKELGGRVKPEID